MAGNRPLVSASVDPELKERLKAIAEAKRWTVSQTVKILLEMFIEPFEEEMGIRTNEVAPTSTRKKSKPKTKPDIK